MNIIYALHKCWCDKIFDKSKPIEFRTKLPKNLKSGTKLYLYETAKNNGARAIVGECVVDYIISVRSERGEWPIVGCYPFIDYYYEKIKGDKELAQYYRDLKEEFDKNKNYRYGFILGYSHSPRELSHLRRTGSLLDLWQCNFDIVNEVAKDNDKSDKLAQECDDWLESIGFYDDGGETYYQYGIVLKDVKKYNTPKPISDFKNKDGEQIKFAPQSFIYTKN